MLIYCRNHYNNHIKKYLKTMKDKIIKFDNDHKPLLIIYVKILYQKIQKFKTYFQLYKAPNNKQNIQIIEKLSHRCT